VYQVPETSPNLPSPLLLETADGMAITGPYSTTQAGERRQGGTEGKIPTERSGTKLFCLAIPTMDPSTNPKDFRGDPSPAAAPIKLTGDSFTGWALGPHLFRVQTPSGATTTRRTELAEMLYAYRYQEEHRLLKPIAERFVRGIDSLFQKELPAFDSLVMVPPPAARSDYPAVIELVSELSRLTGIVSAQFAVKRISSEPLDSASGERTATAYGFSSNQATACFAGKNILAIDDIYRSGRSLHAFCRFLKVEGKAVKVAALVGTVTEKTL
jgi:predicted amidophosphoribosyltransferase